MALKDRFDPSRAIKQVRADKPTVATPAVNDNQSSMNAAIAANAAATAPVVAPVLQPTVQPVETPKAVTPQVINKANLLKNIQKTATGKSGEQANDAFIQGVAQFAKSRSASKEELGAFGTTEFGLKGATVQQVIDRFGIGGELEGFNIPDPIAPVVPVADTGVPGTGEPEPTSFTTSAIDEIITKREAEAQPFVDTEAARVKSTEAEATRMQLARDISNKNIVDKEILQQIQERGGGLLRSTINLRKEDYTEEEYIGNLKAVQDYNDAVIMENLLKGQYNSAVALNSSIAADREEIDILKIEKAQAQDLITANEAKEFKLQAAAEKELSLAGYLKIASPDQLAGLTEDQITRIPNPITGNIDIYKKPNSGAKTEEVTAYVDQINSGNLKLLNVPAALRSEVAIALGSSTGTATTGGGGGNTTTPTAQEERREGDVYQRGSSYYTMGVDGKERKASTAEKNAAISGLTTEEAQFDKELTSERNKLAKGGSWAKSWNFLHNKYPEASNAQLDDMLDKDKYFKQK